MKKESREEMRKEDCIHSSSSSFYFLAKLKIKLCGNPMMQTQQIFIDFPHCALVPNLFRNLVSDLLTCVPDLTSVLYEDVVYLAYYCKLIPP